MSPQEPQWDAGKGIQNTEPVFPNILRSPGVDSQPDGTVRQPYLSYRPAMLHRQVESNPRNRFLVSLNIYKYGLCLTYTSPATVILTGRHSGRLCLDCGTQGVTKRCRLSLLTNRRPLIWAQNAGEGGSCGANEKLSTAVHWSPNKLWRSNSIFNLFMEGTGLHMQIRYPACHPHRVLAGIVTDCV